MPKIHYKGYRITRGSYVGSADDSTKGFYIDHDDWNVVDRRGAGFRTVQDAKNRIDEIEFSQMEQKAINTHPDLICPHCDRWIGDPENIDIADFSEDHDVDACSVHRLETLAADMNR